MSRQSIHKKLRKTVIGTATRPRLAVYRSLNNLTAQLINDQSGETIASANSLKLKGPLSSKAETVAKDIVRKAKVKKIKEAVYDRGGFAYLGVVKLLCETARKEGLKI